MCNREDNYPGLKPIPGTVEVPADAFSGALRESLSNLFAMLPLIIKHNDGLDTRYFTELQRNAYRMLRIVREIELAAELNRGRFLLKPLDLTTLADSIRCAVIGVVSVPVGGESPKEPLVVSANLPVLTHVVLEVVRNALQYTQDGNRITLTLAKKKRAAVLRITDRGLGIRPTHQTHIFEPYYSVDPYGDDPLPPGLGLGLALLHHAARHFGGTVAVKSAFGEGTTIALSLPLCGTGATSQATCSADDLLLNRFSPLYLCLAEFMRALP